MRKTLLFSALLFIFINGILLSQSGWFWQNPLPQGNYLSNVSFVGSQIVYVSGAGGTLLKSTNDGINFSMLQTNIRDDLNLSFINENTGFSPAINGGILRTTTGGTSWEYFIINPDFETSRIQFVSGTNIFALLTSEIIPDRSGRIYKSTDLGQSWVLSLLPSSNTYIKSFHFPAQNIGYAVGSKASVFTSKIYKTLNSGISWDSVTSNFNTTFNSVFFTDLNTGYVTTTYNSSCILKTTNGAINWINIDSLSSIHNDIVFFNGLTGYAKNNAMFTKTTNAGANWEVVYTSCNPFMRDINNGLGIDNWPENFLLRTTNSGENWIPFTTGYFRDLYGVFFINELTGFIASEGRIYKTTNSGNNWSEFIFNLPEGPVAENIMFINENTGYAGLDHGKIAKTTNCGTSWEIYKTSTFDHSHGMSFPSTDTGYIITKYGRLLRTGNGGVNWTLLNFFSGVFGHTCFIDNNTGFAAGVGIYSDKGILLITRNGGATIDSVIRNSAGNFYDVAKADNNTWFAAGRTDEYNGYHYKGLICRSTDAGYNWTDYVLPEVIQSINFSSVNTGYASSYGGVMYKTTNKGNSWFPTRCINGNTSRGLFFINDLTGYAVGNAGQIIKTTTGGGELIGIQPVTNEIPKSFSLSQNYPNPFNPSTVISFHLAVNSLAKLVVYDILGREVTVLVNEQLTSDTYEVSWDGSNFSSGVYFYRLEAGEYSVTNKMVLLK